MGRILFIAVAAACLLFVSGAPTNSTSTDAAPQSSTGTTTTVPITTQELITTAKPTESVSTTSSTRASVSTTTSKVTSTTSTSTSGTKTTTEKPQPNPQPVNKWMVVATWTVRFLIAVIGASITVSILMCLLGFTNNGARPGSPASCCRSCCYGGYSEIPYSNIQSSGITCGCNCFIGLFVTLPVTLLYMWLLYHYNILNFV